MKRFLLMAPMLALLLPLAVGPAEAGHRPHVSWSLGFHWAPTFYVHHYPMAYWITRQVAAPVRDDVGAMRLRVRPKKTEIFLDGQRIGRSAQFDGYPGYLWLEEGIHTLVFYREGFRTFRRSFEVRAGMITEVRVEMERGESRPPEEFFSRPAPREPVSPPATAPPSRGVQPRAEERAGETLDLRAEGARLRLAVEPVDASVYLDGRFLGTGEQLSRLHGGLMLDAGEHQLEVLHPDYLPDRVTFRARSGEEIELRVSLDDPAET